MSGFFMHIDILSGCMLCAYWVPTEAEREMLGSLKLKLQIILSHHVGPGNQTYVLWKSSLCPMDGPSL